MSFFHNIEIVLPKTSREFSKQLLSFLAQFGERANDSIQFSLSNASFLPKISLEFTEFVVPIVRFYTDSHPVNIELVNKTGIQKKSTYKYSHIEISDFMNRLSGKQITYLDHVGFDVPWFDGIHPEIIELRELLKSKCLYHLFPTGEAWDFIIPGTSKEISGKAKIDYSTIRQPKFEIVSLDTVSTPLIQIDFSVKDSYANLKKMFPEAIHDKKLKNMWVYIQNPYNIDICFVVNEHTNADWSEFFKGSRLEISV